jgi:peptidoglycan/xylan/chitin deacetylase (PgdA/CDA1 family)
VPRSVPYNADKFVHASFMLKQSLKRALIGSRALRLMSHFAGGGMAIVMYHSVQDDPREQFDMLGGIIHSTQVFRGQMEVIARHFQPATLEDVLRFLSGDRDPPPRSVLITFDDGYVDNYEVAKPVLDEFGIPAVFYVVVDCVDQQKLPWPAQLRQMFLTAKTRFWRDSGGKSWALDTREERLQAYAKAAEECAKVSGVTQRGFLEVLAGELAAAAVTPHQPMMSWEQIRSLDRSGHTIGSHTMSHPNMAQVCAKDAEMEFAESKRRLEHELRKPMVHFSYPCPAARPYWADHTRTLSQKTGYRSAVTTAGGMVRKRDDTLMLKRIRPTKTVEGVRWNLERTFCGATV